MKVAGLFAGIGGLESGLSSAGHEAIMLCEIWEPAQAVLKARFPHVGLHADISALQALPEATELVTAGFPCQDLSQAGRTAGITGERSGLVGHIFRLLDQRRVPWVVLENVAFMLHLDKGKALRTIVEAFEERGYRWAYRIVDTLSFLPQRRERVIFVATNTDADPANVLLSDDFGLQKKETNLSTHAHGFYWTEGVRGLGWAQDAIPPLKNGSTVGIASPPAILLPNGDAGTPDIRDAERLQGFDVDWTKPASQVGRASLRWSLVGNAVSVPVAAWLGRRLTSPGHYEKGRDLDLEGSRWPKAARFDGARRFKVEIGTHPTWQERPPLDKFLMYTNKPLSERATRGFLSRADRSSLRFVPGFLDRLRLHLERMQHNEIETYRNDVTLIAAE
ncbi:MAG TPA: DNA (cytosine-5-)-methyltransferase [Pseudorhizobium sp.]|nr:DNA (cytosine-5-)-methyltransferase [Pseudorhizobium sp.]